MKNSKVLVLATSSKTRGGITSVINSYKSTYFWRNWNCIWIETHIDKHIFFKLIYFFKSIFIFLFHLPSSTIIHIHISGVSSLKRKMIFIRLSKFFNKKNIIHFHAFSDKANIKKENRNIYKNFFSKANKILVLSESWKVGVVKDLNISNCKVDVLYNPCPVVSINNDIKKEKIILFAGTLNQRKNYKNLIYGFSIIAKNYPEWKLVFAGNGEIENVKTISKKLDILNQVHCVGWLKGESKAKLFNKSSIFCLPSYAEGFPMAVLDAWAYELPVISTSVGGINDIAIDKENICLIEPDNHLQISQVLEQLLVDTDLNKRLIKAAKNFKTTVFSLNNIVNQLNQIYQKL